MNIAEYINQNTNLPYIIENEKYEFLKSGDLIFADASEDKDGIGKASFISRDKYDFNIVGGTHTIATRPNQSIVQSEFIYFFSKTNQFRKYAMKMATGTKIYGITYSSLAKMLIASPLNTEEQEKIIKMISNIEDLITLHNKKVDLLKKLLDAYSVYLFAFKSNTPLVRFSNFNNDWEMFKVKDLFTVTRGQVLSVDKISKFKTDNNKYPVYSSQTHNNGLLGYYHDFLFDTAITWTTDGANAGTVKFRSGKFYSTNVNGVLISDDGYACEAVAKIIENETPRWVVRVGNPKLMNNVMSDITIKISNDVNELEKISDIFVKLNILIELEKDIIEKLEKLKKEYLNYLFI